MKRHALTRADYGAIVVAQREWARLNPAAVYRSRLTLDDYLAQPYVAEPLCRYDCVPIVAGADAVVVVGQQTAGGPGVRVAAVGPPTTTTTRRSTGSRQDCGSSHRRSGRRRATGLRR